MGRKFFVGGNWKCNGTTEEVKKIVTTLNEAEVPSEDVVAEEAKNAGLTRSSSFRNPPINSFSNLPPPQPPTAPLSNTYQSILVPQLALQ